MVTTRSGEVRRYGVRFKRGPAVRRILEFNDEDEIDALLNSASNTEMNTNAVASNGGILLNGTHSEALISNGEIDSSDELSTEQNTFGGETILYNVNDEDRKYLGSTVWDIFLFTVIVLISYFSASLVYLCCGYVLYLVSAALCIVMFSYNVAYFDSTTPGVVPPSPVSPALYRRTSGHTYHLSYVMSFINGLIFLLIEPYILSMIIPPV